MTVIDCFFTPQGIVAPYVRRRLRPRRRTHSFGYNTNMVQQKFIQTLNPSQHFFTQGHKSKN